MDPSPILHPIVFSENVDFKSKTLNTLHNRTSTFEQVLNLSRGAFFFFFSFLNRISTKYLDDDEVTFSTPLIHPELHQV